MKERKKVSTSTLIRFLITLVIALFTITGCSSIYEGITGDNELKHEKHTKKIEA